MSSTGPTVAHAINDLGEITVESNGRAVYWSSNLMVHDLGVLGGHLRAYASDINDAVLVVGTSWIANFIGFERAFIWTPGGVMQDLKTLLDETGDDWLLREANAINIHGQIVGRRSRRTPNACIVTHADPEPGTMILAVLSGAAAVALPRRARVPKVVLVQPNCNAR